MFEPTLTICGLDSGWQGAGAKTVLPAEAHAKMDFRLVPDQDPETVHQALRAHLDAQGFSDVEIRYLGGQRPARVDPDHPLVQLAAATAQEVYGKPASIVPIVGGSGPMWWFAGLLGLPVTSPGIEYPGIRVHAPNEHIRLDDFTLGTRHLARLLSRIHEAVPRLAAKVLRINANARTYSDRVTTEEYVTPAFSIVCLFAFLRVPLRLTAFERLTRRGRARYTSAMTNEAVSQKLPVTPHADKNAPRRAGGLATLVNAVLTFIGESALLAGRFVTSIVRGGVDMRDLMTQMAAIGADSIWIVLVVTTATGAVFSLYTTALANSVGGLTQFVGGTLGYAFLNELGPVLGGVAFAARAGAAIAAEIGTMVVTEQVDALRAMAVSPTRYLVVPRVLAAVLMLPLLTLFADLAGMIGGYLFAGVSGVPHADSLTAFTNSPAPKT